MFVGKSFYEYGDSVYILLTTIITIHAIVLPSNQLKSSRQNEFFDTGNQNYLLHCLIFKSSVRVQSSSLQIGWVRTRIVKIQKLKKRRDPGY